MTRITQRLLNQSTLANLQNSLGRTEKLQERLSTGRVLNRPSDSPTALVTAMQTRSSLARKETHLRSLDNAKGWVDTADAALQGAASMVRRARELVIQGANASTGQIGRDSIAQEIESIRAGLVGVANTSYAGRYLFAGNTDAPPFADDGTYAFAGDAGKVQRTVADGQQVQINVIGADAFGDGPTSLFALLDTIAAELRTNADVGARVTDLDTSRDLILTELGGLGARANRIDGIHDRATVQKMNLQTRLSEVESVDLTETIMELQMQEVAYQAALGATARVIQPSLLDFLR